MKFAYINKDPFHGSASFCQESFTKEDVETETLNLLVNFAHQLENANLMPPDSPTEPPSPKSSGAHPPDPEGCKAKHAGAPPLYLPPQPSADVVTDPMLAPASSKAAPSSYSRGSGFGKPLPGPVPDDVQSTKGRLVCTPDQMKQFLFGSQQKISDQSTSGSDVSCQ